MPLPFNSAHLDLELFELRRAPVLREARAWFLASFSPESIAELVALAIYRSAVRCRLRNCPIWRIDAQGG